MNYYILILDNSIKSFSMVGSGTDINYVFAYKDKQDIFKNSNVGDKIIGYLNSPVDQFLYVFEIQNKVSDKECVLKKQLELETGLDLVKAEKSVVTLVNSNKATTLFFDITENNYNSLIKQMADVIGDKLKSVTSRKVNYLTKLPVDIARNRIVFGAPGTGKSRRLEDSLKKMFGDDRTHYERVTFHPEYTYGAFVGTYKPVEDKDENGNDTIRYKYVPGPFMRMLVKALESGMSGNPEAFVLIIEEINRSNVSAVFGDVFQLLDRKDNYSEYPINASEDMKKYLNEQLGIELNEIRIPDNLFIWATMNSADQGVFPMDTAFKRRWTFEYIGVDDGEKDESGQLNVPGEFVMHEGEPEEIRIQWNALRKAINDLLSCDDVKAPEDKLLGPFFVNSNRYLKDGSVAELVTDFYKIVETKVLMYLFEDAAKTKRASVFIGKANTNRFSVLCKEFENNPLGIFAKIGDKEFSDVYDSYTI